MPRRRRYEDDYDDDEDDYDDRPRRRAAKSGVSIGLLLGIVFGSLFLFAALGFGYFLFAKSMSKPKPTPPPPVFVPAAPPLSEPAKPQAASTVEKIDQVCTLSNLQRLDQYTGTPKIEVTYTFNEDANRFASYKIVVKTRDGTNSLGLGVPVKVGTSETITLQTVLGPQTLRNGKMEVWIERTVNGKSERVSNVVYKLF